MGEVIVPFWKDRDVVRYVSNGLGALAAVSLLGFPGLVGYAAGFIVNTFVPQWAGVE